MSRRKNMLDFTFTVMLFACVGFMFAFGASNGFWLGIDTSFLFLAELDAWGLAFFTFQVMFCGTAATIVSGAVAERMPLRAYVLGSIVVAAFIYPVFVHWAWGNRSFESESAFLAIWALSILPAPRSSTAPAPGWRWPPAC
jgi:Amt family ammonium transporter